jgi:DNA-binding NtrC family response regulator
VVGSVLLLEDDAAIRDLVHDLIADEGLAVTAYRSRNEFQRAIKLGTSDLALVDAWGSSHLELSDSERQELIEVADLVPTILYTARSWATRASPEELHVLAIVSKPGDVYDVARLVRRAAEVIDEVKEGVRRLQEARVQSRAAQDLALVRIEQSSALIAAVKARLGDR